MPCYRCGARQTDPEQGKPSPWRRGVRREHQVLVCPECFSAAAGELDSCPECGGTQLIRRLDQVECLSCGQSRDVGASDVSEDVPAAPGATPEPEPAVPPQGGPPQSTLAAEVSEALGRLFE